MAITLNLLPQDRIISGDLFKILKFTRILGVISLAIFIIYSIFIGVFIFLNSNKIRTLQSTSSTLKSQVIQLESSEAQIILIKDRIKKIQTLQAMPSSLNNLASTVSLLQNLSDRARVTELDVDSKKSDLSVNFKSNFEMENFLDLIRNSDEFKSVVVGSYGFNPTTGYLVTFNLNTK